MNRPTAEAGVPRHAGRDASLALSLGALVLSSIAGCSVLDATGGDDGPPGGDTEPVACFEGDASFESDETGSCYSLFLASVTWFDAADECDALGGHLVTIAGPLENEIVGELSGPQPIWIGLTDLDNEGEFLWITGEPFTFQNFSIGEPNDSGNEDCVQIDGNQPGEWNDRECDARAPFVCERDA